MKLDYIILVDDFYFSFGNLVLLEEYLENINIKFKENFLFFTRF